MYSDENDPPGQVVYSDENDRPEQVGREIQWRAQPASPPSLEILRSLKALKGEISYGSRRSSLTSARRSCPGFPGSLSLTSTYS